MFFFINWLYDNKHPYALVILITFFFVVYSSLYWKRKLELSSYRRYNFACLEPSEKKIDTELPWLIETNYRFPSSMRTELWIHGALLYRLYAGKVTKFWMYWQILFNVLKRFFPLIVLSWWTLQQVSRLILSVIFLYRYIFFILYNICNFYIQKQLPRTC